MKEMWQLNTTHDFWFSFAIKDIVETNGVFVFYDSVTKLLKT